MALNTAATLRHRLSKSYSGLLARGWLVPAFLVVWVGMVILPLAILLTYSFFESRSFRTIYTPSLTTWETLFSSGRWEVALRTLRIALTLTLFELAMGFPFAVWLAKGCKSRGLQAFILSLLTIPFFLDISSRTIVWRAILGQNGLINSILIGLGVIDQPVEWMLYTEFSVHFGMIAPYFPTMVLPIYLAVSFIDDELIEASSDLGASPLQNLVNIIIPLSLPGVMAGIIFTLGPALAAWVEPGMLGGGFVNLLSNSVESAYTALKYPTLAALSTLVILLLAVTLVLMVLVTRRLTNLGGVFRVMRK
jgi:ABC-type spermidine/putrescine transport system permease subunit I